MKNTMKKSRKANRKLYKKSCRGFTGILVLVMTFIVISGFVFADSVQAMAKTELADEGKFYKSITIKKGDTLWDIANEYMTDDYESVEEYVCVLKEMNNLKSDKILFGDKLVVAYNAPL